MDVIIDTNALLYLYKFRIRLLEQLDELVAPKNVYVLQGTIDELNLFRLKKGKMGRAANLALEFIRQNKDRIKILKHEQGKVDDCIIREAKKLNAVILTNDKKLIEKAKSEGISVVGIRNYSKLAFF